MDNPNITPDEERVLRVVIEDWETRNALQRAIAVSVLRGHDSPHKVAENLHITVEEVHGTLPSVWGLLLDRFTDKIWIK
jgi:hypothetical protein